MRLIGYDPRARQLYLPRLQPLAQYLGRRSADKSALLPVAILGVLEGVAKLHEHGVCHRDLKLDNVLIAGPLALVPPGAGLTLIPTLTPTLTPTLALNLNASEVVHALECSARAHFDTVRPLPRHTTAAAPELARRCTQLRNDHAAPPPVCETACLGPNRSNAHKYSEGLFPSFGACRDIRKDNDKISLDGFVVRETNTTVIFRLHSIASSAHSCLACVEGPQGTCDRIDACDFDTAPLPSHMSLMPAVGADAVVFNFGLHYSNEKRYRAHMVRLMQEMASFGQQSGKAAVFRETSVQHFPVASGDYHDAIARDPSLVVVVRNGTRGDGKQDDQLREWHGGSFCAARSSSSPQSWRNQVVHDVVGREGLTHAVAIQPFENLTAPMWDFHQHPVWRNGRWSSDCTHFCYSPRFWDRSFHDMYHALRRGFMMSRAKIGIAK